MDKKRAQELLSSADKCFEEAGVLVLFEKFGSETEVSQIIEKFYAEYEERAEFCVQNAPENLKSHAQEMKAKLTGQVENFKKDVMANFKVQLLMALESFKSRTEKAIDVKATYEAFFEERTIALKKITQVASTLSEILKEDFIFALYDGFVPIYPDPELKDFFDMLDKIGLKAIPGEYVIPGINGEETSEAEESCE